MLAYRFDESKMRLTELENDSDVEFRIFLLSGDPALVEGMKRVRQFFDENEVYTDVLFYQYPDREYKAIVRKDYYTDFILELMKRQLLLSVAWEDGQ